MTCRVKPKPEFLRDLRNISEKLSLEWNHKDGAFDVYERAKGNKKYWVLQISPWMQDQRSLDLLRMNNMWNEDTYADLRAKAEAKRVFDRHSKAMAVREEYGALAQEMGERAACPSTFASGDTRLNAFTAEMNKRSAAQEPESVNYGDDW